jgi:hypothetical protein
MVNAFLLRWSANWGQRLLNIAANRLRERLWALRRLYGHVGLAEICDHARLIQLETGCVLLTDPVIAEAVRAAAEEAPHPDPVLELLITQVRDPGGLKPMSIASTNRLLAYLLSGFSLSLFAFWLQLTLASPSSESDSAMSLARAAVGVWGLLLIQGWLSFLNLRALAFWRGRCRAIADADITRALCPAPRRLSWMSDFFAWMMSVESYYTVHVWWAPVWEGFCFGLLPLVCGIYGGLWLTAQILKATDASPEIIRQVVFYEAIIFPLIFVIGWGTYFFVMLHEYRWLEARRLRRRLETLRRDCLLFKMRVLAINPINEYVSVARRLWVITGYEPYRNPLQFLK